jgi:hypothetical protein
MCTDFTRSKRSGAAKGAVPDAANRGVSKFTIAGSGLMAELTE